MIRVNTDSRSSSNVTRNYKWNVKITQIDCTSKLEEIRNLKGKIYCSNVKILNANIINIVAGPQNLHTKHLYNLYYHFIAPEGCLQYFQDREGTVSSFNWDGLNSRQYMINQHYSICFKRGSSDCQVHIFRYHSHL